MPKANLPAGPQRLYEQDLRREEVLAQKADIDAVGQGRVGSPLCRVKGRTAPSGGGQ